MTQNWDFFDFPITLGFLNVEVVFRQDLQSFKGVSTQLFLSISFEDKIIHVNGTFPLSDHVMEDGLHHVHKGSRRIT